MKTKPSKSAGAVTTVIPGVDDKPAYDPLLYTKQYTNGHKFFMASEAKALAEMLNTETRCQQNFNHLRTKMIKPRNPLCGDETPRDLRGNVVLNPNAHGTIVNGDPLFSGRHMSDSLNISRKFAPKGTVGKIGVKDSNYDILGNKEPFAESISSQPDNLFLYTQTQQRAKTAALEEKRTINEYIAIEKAKRLEKDLTKQLSTLRLQAAEKERELQHIQQQTRTFGR